MARKETTFIAVDGRDKDKEFLITEMSAYDAESWAMRALMALMDSNKDFGDALDPQNGMSGIAAVGLKALAGLRFDVAKPLLDEMMQCVQIIPTRSKQHIKRALVDGDIEEVATLFKLRLAILELHTGFYIAANQ